MNRTGGWNLSDMRRPRIPLAPALLWLLAAVLAVRQAAHTLSLPPERRLTDLETWLGTDGVLHLPGSLYDGDAHGKPFSGTPFAGLVLRPFTSAAEETLGVLWTIGTLLIVAAVGVLVARSVTATSSRRARLLAAPVLISLMVVSLPVRGTLSLGQLSLLPVLLVLPACLAREPGRGAGVAAGLAMALQPVMLLFAPFLWLTGKRTAALTSAGTFAAGTALAWAALPKDSLAYWVHHVAGAGLERAPDALANQSLHGLLLRAGLHGAAEYTALAVLALPLLWFGTRRAVAYARDGQAVLGAVLVGCVVVAVSPVSWQHQQLWILLAAAGRLGKGRSDRLVWPLIVAAVMLFDSEQLLPGRLHAVRMIADNAPLILAVAAAVAVPFLVRGSADWVATTPELAPNERAPGRRIPLLPRTLRVLSRPNLFLELILIRVGYSFYSFIRASVPDQRATAESHGRDVIGLERFLHIDVEHALNHLAARTDWLKAFTGFFYETFHFLVPLSLLAWLYIKRPAQYRSARTVLCVGTATGLIGFWLYPLAPPRLMPGFDYIDTAHGVQDLNNPDFGALTKLSNQYAAMPSLHVGWALWCGLVIFALAPYLWMRLAGLLYPLTTTFVVMATANHYILDAVGGVAVITIGFAVQYALTGRSAFAAPDDTMPPKPPEQDNQPISRKLLFARQTR
ncbi:bifunctional glycosyltransferase 87/phosphatase PAP2 family protein [Yinghuangia seranimata]|uniref:bifunctional glycosyltransferase 87/phosphatase PAP2 family protein n=1 Tax=Yinghuangia seranimata TaxID=408067 RepID=UPI00248BB99A|nr:bifunctional glycosyltransferase 87/phosphatase PAP2 family protein [Yinghuangia seranimata]MDI2131971.1 bifunctional glycosyltransferase 87/phosphatase PAP2 family protein [Yinghuangia seranimata]